MRLTVSYLFFDYIEQSHETDVKDQVWTRSIDSKFLCLHCTDSLSLSNFDYPGALSLFPNPNHVPSNTRFAFPFHNREVATSGASALSSYTKPLLSIHSAKSVHKDLLYTAAACFTGLHKDRAPKVDVNQQQQRLKSAVAVDLVGPAHPKHGSDAK